MRKKICLIYLRILSLLLLFVCLHTSVAYSAGGQKDFYQIQIFKVINDEQMQQVNAFLKNAYLPALHKSGIKNIGVFKPVKSDTASAKNVYVFIPYTSPDEWLKIQNDLQSNKAFKAATKSFDEAPYDHPPFERMESVLLEALDVKSHYSLSTIKNEPDKVFELRSYESPTESLFEKKLKMFNEAGETDIFNRLGFEAIFYAKVVSGCRMPNLMYMTVYKNIDDRNAHWKSFSEDAGWKELSVKPEFENKVSVSHIDSILLQSAEYSDI